MIFLNITSATTILPDNKFNEFSQTSIWIPVITVIILSILFMLIVVFAQKLFQKCSKIYKFYKNYRTNNVNEIVNEDSPNGIPSTPPPSYSILERQVSYISQMSLCSSQIEYPPDYSDLGTINSKKLSSNYSSLSYYSHPEIQKPKLFSRPSLNSYIAKTFIRQISEQQKNEIKPEVNFMITSGSISHLPEVEDQETNKETQVSLKDASLTNASIPTTTSQPVSDISQSDSATVHDVFSSEQEANLTVAKTDAMNDVDINMVVKNNSNLNAIILDEFYLQNATVSDDTILNVVLNQDIIEDVNLHNDDLNNSISNDDNYCDFSNDNINNGINNTNIGNNSMLGATTPERINLAFEQDVNVTPQ